jgi:hypothetical protein
MFLPVTIQTSEINLKTGTVKEIRDETDNFIKNHVIEYIAVNDPLIFFRNVTNELYYMLSLLLK